MKHTIPIASLISAVVLVGMALIAIAFVPLNSQTSPILLTIIGLIVTTVPSLVAAAFAERAARDIRNGTLKGKVKDALAETGVTRSAERSNAADTDRNDHRG